MTEDAVDTYVICVVNRRGKNNGAKAGGKCQGRTYPLGAVAPPNEPSPDFREHSCILNGLQDILHLVRIDHEHIPRRIRVLLVGATRIQVFPSFRYVGRVDTDDLPFGGGPRPR